MKKYAVFLFLLTALCLLTSCGDDNDTPSRVSPPNYQFSTTPTSQEATLVPTTLSASPTDVLPSVNYFNNTIWEDFDDIQKSATTGATDLKAEAGEITVFNYPSTTVLSYFSQLAFSDESTGNVGFVRKWQKPLYYEIYGSADEVDAAVIRWLATELNGVNGFPGMYAADANNKANVRFYFGNISEVQSQLGLADATLQSASRMYWQDGKYSVMLAKIGIVNDVTSREERTSAILEEMLQILGLMQGSTKYPQSVFYRNGNIPQVPDELDWTMVRLLYSPDIKIGMSEADAITAASEMLVTYYATGVVYTNPEVDFELLAQQYADEKTSTATSTEPTTSVTDPTTQTSPVTTTAPTDPPPTTVPTTTEPTTEKPVETLPTTPVTDPPTLPPTEPPTEELPTDPPEEEPGSTDTTEIPLG